MAFVEGVVTVEVPATSANLGPGFDCLGLALDLRDTLQARVIEDGLVIEVQGEGAADVPRDASHLVVRAMTATFEAIGVAPPPLHLQSLNVIPHSRGLGSSSAAIVGGIALARGLVVGGADLLDDAAALVLANSLEGHPDNVAPALYGGFEISGQANGEVWAVRAPVDPGIATVVFVPSRGVRTEVARGLLPDAVAHGDAAANSGRAALLVAALGGAPDRLLRATEDFLHQEHREPAMPDSLALVRRLRADGVPAVISGAGPTVLAFIGPGLTTADELRSRCPQGWIMHQLAISDHGVSVRID